MINRKEVNLEESNVPVVYPKSEFKSFTVKNAKLIKDSIERSIASNIPLVKLFFYISIYNNYFFNKLIKGI